MRNVYFDPFGARLAGYQAGQNDEIQMQDQTRRARASDYQHNVLNPLQLQGLQRTENFAQYADPYQRNAIARNDDYDQFALPLRKNALQYADATGQGSVFDAERQRRQTVAQANGNFGMIEGLDNGRYSNQQIAPAQTHAVDSPANLAFDDWMALMQMEGLQPDDPIADNYRQQLEQAYGMAPGSLWDPASQGGPQTYTQTPATMGWTDPQTGQVVPYQTAPGSYRQQALQPQALQQAEFGLRAGQAQQAAQWADIQRGWQMQRMGGAAGAAGGAEEDYFLGE